jgi:F0F1-type ATP synthase assembly protein I
MTGALARAPKLSSPPDSRASAYEDRLGAMNGSSEFTTWVALAGAAIVAGLTAIYSSSPWVLIAAALIGAYVGYKGEQVGRRYIEQRLAEKRSR